MADLTPRYHSIASGAEAGTLPDEFMVVAGDDGTDIHPLQLTATGDLKVTLDSEVVDTELPAAAALADDTANPTVPAVGSFGMGWDSTNTNWNRVEVDDAGHLQVDVLTGGGVDTPTNPVNDYNTQASLAASGTFDAQTVDFGAATKKAVQVIASASVPIKAEFGYNDNDVKTVLAVGFAIANGTVILEPTHRDYWSHTFTANAGHDGFECTITNLGSSAADVYCTIMYED